MRLLALDAATEACSAAVAIDGRIAQRYELPGRGHAERILAMIDEVLAEAGADPRTLDAIVVGRGPGAFTGVRLAIGVAQGLAIGWRLPVVAVSELAAVAYRALSETPEAGQALVCNDARMGEVYWAVYRRASGDALELLGVEHVGLPATVPVPAAERTVLAGSGFAVYPQLTKRLAAELGTSLVAVREACLPRAVDLLALGAIAFSRGEATTAEAVAPVYLRDDIALPQTRR